MLAPGFVVVAGVVAKGAEHAFEIVRILQANVLINERRPPRRNVCLKWYAGHTDLLTVRTMKVRATENDLSLGIILNNPPSGVAFGLQKGRGPAYETVQKQISSG